jgi:hypothetical protein
LFLDTQGLQKQIPYLKHGIQTAVGILENHLCQTGKMPAPIQIPDIPSPKIHPARGGKNRTDADASQGSLARPGFSDHPQALPRKYLEVHTAQSIKCPSTPQSETEIFFQVFCLQESVAHK